MKLPPLKSLKADTARRLNTAFEGNARRSLKSFLKALRFVVMNQLSLALRSLCRFFDWREYRLARLNADVEEAQRKFKQDTRPWLTSLPTLRHRIHYFESQL